MIVDGKQVNMLPVERWYLDVALPHSAANRGAEARIYLVVDCLIDSFVNDLVGYDIIEHRKANADVYRQHVDRMIAEYQRELRRYKLKRMPGKITARLGNVFKRIRS